MYWLTRQNRNCLAPPPYGGDQLGLKMWDQPLQPRWICEADSGVQPSSPLLSSGVGVTLEVVSDKPRALGLSLIQRCEKTQDRPLVAESHFLAFKWPPMISLDQTMRLFPPKVVFIYLQVQGKTGSPAVSDSLPSGIVTTNQNDPFLLPKCKMLRVDGN